MSNQPKEKKLLWYNLAFMAFSTVWGFNNVINGFSEYGGLRAILAWLLIFAVYFVPYTLMVGELGSAFKEEGGGVSAWVAKTIGPNVAYMAGWTYWVVHMPYISQKPNSTVIAASWAIFQNNSVSQMNTRLMALVCLALFLIAVLIASRGMSILKKLSSFAGISVFIMSMLYIVMMLAAPAITGAKTLDIKWSVETFLPTFDSRFFLNLSILVLAVGGCEKVSPYVNKMKDPAKDFSKGMITLAAMVAACAVLGTIAMGMMFDSNNIPKDLMTNGAYYAFQQVGEYYHIGNTLVIVYAIVNVISQFAVMVLSIDAPLRILLGTADETRIPKALYKQNKYGAYTNGNILITVIVSILIVLPVLGIQNIDNLVRWLVKINSVCMPLRYLWVFTAYIALKKAGEKFSAEYRFTKNKGLGMFFGGWCFFVTAFACVMGIYSSDPFELTLNIITPIALVGLGFIMPVFAKRSLKKQG